MANLICFLLLIFSAVSMAATPSGKITIETPLFQGGAGTAFFYKCAREYEKVRPNVHVDMTLDPRIADKVRVRILEGSWFELTNAAINYWPLIHNGDVLKLNKYLDGPNWEHDSTWRDSFLPGTLDGYMDDKGDIYGIPLADYAQLIWYNKKIFRDHGWKIPVTWQDMFALCKKMKDAGVTPFAFQGRYPIYAEPLYDAAYYHLAGPKQWLAREKVTPGTFNDAAGIKSIALVQELASYFQPGCLGMTHTEAQLQFFLGNTAMIPCGAWLKSEMMGKIPNDFELGCFNLPIVKGGKGDPSAVIVKVEPFVIMTKSAHPEIAVDFMKFMTSRKMCGLFARMQDIPVAVKGANKGNLTHDLDQMVDIINNAKASYGMVPGEGYPEMQQVYTDELYQTVRGVESPKQIANELERKARDIRNSADHPNHVIINYMWEPILLLSILGLGLIYFLWMQARRIGRRSLKPVSHDSRQHLSWGNILIFVLPSLAIYTLFVIVPSVRSFSWSLHQWNGLTDMATMPYKGFLNFRRLLFESDAFWIALKNNLFLMFVIPAFVVPLSLFLAAAISRGVWGSNTFRVVFFFPNLIGGVAATLLWLHLYNPQGGLVNVGLVDLGKAMSFIGLGAVGGHWLEGFNGFAWLDASHLYWSLVPISIWGACGFNMILYLAGMESIPESFYEAAKIDGASQWRQFWTITLPLIWEMLAISLVFLIIGGMKAFDIIWLLTNQKPNTDNHVIATLMVQKMFTEFKVGQATAIAVLLFLMVFVCTAVTLRGMQRESVEL